MKAVSYSRRTLLQLAFGALCCLGAASAPAAGNAANPASSPNGNTLLDASGVQVQLPARAQRIIALSETDLDALLALGVQPVGATRGRGQTDFPAYLNLQKTTIRPVGNFASPVLDIVLSLQPDLILAGGLNDPELIAQMRKIAPVVISFQPGAPWQNTLRTIAQAVGQSAQAEVLLKNYQQQASNLRSRLSKNHPNASVSIVRWNPLGPAFMQQQAFASLVLADLGLQRPVAQRIPGFAHSQPLSLEALDKIDADWLFLGTLSRSGNDPAAAALAKARASSSFAQLGAVKSGHVMMVDGSLWTGPGGPLAALAIISDVDKAMPGK